MYIPVILQRHRIMGKDRIEPCKCGHFHKGKIEKLPFVTLEETMKMLDTYVKYVVWPGEDVRTK